MSKTISLTILLLIAGCSSQPDIPSVDASVGDFDAVSVIDAWSPPPLPEDTGPEPPPPLPTYCELHPQACCGSCAPYHLCPPGEGCCFAWRGSSLFCAPDLETCANLGGFLGCVPPDAPACEPHFEPSRLWAICE